jgi:hypothetical protein
MPRLAKGAETSICMAFLVMCAEKIRRLLRLFFVPILPGYALGNGQPASGRRSEKFTCSSQPNPWSLGNRA